MPLRTSAFAASLSALMIAAPAGAQSAVGFDCDTPSGRTSSISAPVGPAVRVAARITPVGKSAGTNPTNGGLLVSSADGKNAIGLQLVLPKPDAPALALMLVGRTNGTPVRQQLGNFAFGAPVDVAILLDAAGTGRITIGDKAIPLTFANLGTGKATAFCGAGQFRFENLVLASS